MHFPGSKLLSQDISTRHTQLEEVIQNCERVNLSGYVDISFGDSEGLVLFYLGEQINIIYRAGAEPAFSAEAMLKLRNMSQLKEGRVSIYELPLDIAHMLRGLSNRQEIFGQIFASAPLKDLLKKLEAQGHTGSLEVLTDRGTGMLLLVRGRVSNVYFETDGGVTFEKGEALNKIYELLDRPEVSARVFQSEFSPDIWKARHEQHRTRASRLTELLDLKRVPEPEPEAAVTPPHEPPAEEKREEVLDRAPARRRLLETLRDHTPSMLAAFLFELDSEVVLAELVEAPQETKDRLLLEKLPAFIRYLQNLAEARGDDHVESLSMSTENFYLVVRCMPEAREGVALITDKSQPLTLANAALLNGSHRYLAHLAGTLTGGL